jgi:hypothetical protein
MRKHLLNFIMNDGSRQSGELPQTSSWHELREHLEKLNGVTVTDFITDDITEVWIDFTLGGHLFSINNQFGDYWFFVSDPNCPDELLTAVLSHSSLLLGEERTS